MKKEKNTLGENKMSNPVKDIIMSKGEAVKESFYTAMVEVRVSEEVYNDPAPLPQMTMKELFDMLASLPNAVVQEDTEQDPEEETFNGL